MVGADYVQYRRPVFADIGGPAPQAAGRIRTVLLGPTTITVPFSSLTRATRPGCLMDHRLGTMPCFAASGTAVTAARACADINRPGGSLSNHRHSAAACLSLVDRSGSAPASLQCAYVDRIPKGCGANARAGGQQAQKAPDMSLAMRRPILNGRRSHVVAHSSQLGNRTGNSHREAVFSGGVHPFEESTRALAS